jgi:hypothetical protein
VKSKFCSIYLINSLNEDSVFAADDIEFKTLNSKFIH